MLRSVLRGQTAAEAAQATAVRVLGTPLDTDKEDPVVACYIDQNFVSLLHLLSKYHSFSDLVLANANCGGENVHRGLVLGALIGAQVGASGIPRELKEGLHHSQAIEAEVLAFVAARIGDHGTCAE